MSGSGSGGGDEDDENDDEEDDDRCDDADDVEATVDDIWRRGDETDEMTRRETKRATVGNQTELTIRWVGGWVVCWFVGRVVKRAILALINHFL